MRLKKKAITLLLAMSIFAQTATAAPSCQEVLSKCDTALAAKNTEIKKLELGLTQSAGRITDLEAQVKTKDDQLRAWYHNPFVLFGLGIVAGAVVIETSRGI
jgi:hypothetical protein